MEKLNPQRDIILRLEVFIKSIITVLNFPYIQFIVIVYIYTVYSLVIVTPRTTEVKWK